MRLRGDNIARTAMYLRHTVVRKKGKAHTYWRLVRSVRIGSKVRQETVAHLGELDGEGRARASALAEHFLGRGAREPELFEDTTRFEPTKVLVDRASVERGRAFGDVYLGWKLWQSLELDALCEQRLPRGKEAVPWAQMAAILVIARLCAPSSELQVAEDWYRRTALEDFLGVPAHQVHHTRLYQTLDRLLEIKVDLEVHLKKRLGELFALDYDLLLYDVTSTYFEGKALGNPLAQRGYSRDQRPDCKQVCIGLVVDRTGFPLAHEVFAGNRADVTTVEEIVEGLEARYGKAKRVFVMDRGMVSEETLAWLRQEGRHYVVATPRKALRHWKQELTEPSGWQSVRHGLEVKICPGPDGHEVFLLCRSEDRREKDAAMRERFTLRIRKGLESLKRRLGSARRRIDRGQVERQLGRLLQRNSRASGKFAIEVAEDRSHPSGLRLRWKEKADWNEWAELTEGAYLLRSNVTTWTPEDLWQTYVQLYEAEAAFRIQKSDLSIRPIWHHHEDRVRAHILVCFLAYALWKTLQGWQEMADLGSSPRTMLEELARLHTVDVVLPLETGKELRLRCVVRPEKATEILLKRLGMRLPKRLRVPPPGVEM